MEPILILSSGSEESDAYARLLGLTLGDAGMDWLAVTALSAPLLAPLCLLDETHPDLDRAVRDCGARGIPVLLWGMGGEDTAGRLARPVDLRSLPERCRGLLPQDGAQKSTPVLRLSFSRETGTAYLGREPLPLTGTEYALLLYLYDRKGSAAARDEIAEAVFGHGEKGNEVDVYVRYLRRKLEKVTDRRLIVSVRGVGYRLSEEA